jgi:hypothetical protein
MKVECPNCQRKYSILEEKPPPGEEIPFSCPACKTAIEGHLPSDSEQDRPSSESASPDKGQPSNEALKKEILQTLSALPPMPQVLSKAREVMGNPKSGFKELAGVLETDQAIAARVLKLANSAYYGLSGKVSSI